MIGAAENSAERIAKLPRCEVCGKPMAGGQRFTHHSCEPGAMAGHACTCRDVDALEHYRSWLVENVEPVIGPVDSASPCVLHGEAS